MPRTCATRETNFFRVIPEYSRTMEESDILENAFQIIFAFDEIVALGYRESVNLAQIRLIAAKNIMVGASLVAN